MKIRLANNLKEDVLYIDLNKIADINPRDLDLRITGEFKGKAYWLSKLCDWHIGTDDEDELILVATVRE